MAYAILLSLQARKDIETLTPKLREKLRTILINALAENPYQGKKLVAELAGSYSYRLTFKDRIVYGIDEAAKTIYIKRARSHYGD